MKVNTHPALFNLILFTQCLYLCLTSKHKTHILTSLQDLLLSLPSNITFWNTGHRILTLLELLAAPSTDLKPLLTILTKMMPKFSVEDTERLFDFLVANREKEELVSARLAILKQLYIEMRTSPVLLDHLRSIGSFQVNNNINKAPCVCYRHWHVWKQTNWSMLSKVVFSLMESHCEQTRVAAIKLLGLLVSKNRFFD